MKGAVASTCPSLNSTTVAYNEVSKSKMTNMDLVVVVEPADFHHVVLQRIYPVPESES